MFALALTQSVNFVNCPKHRNNKKKYKLNNQRIFDRNKRSLKSTWDSKNKKEYHTRKSIKTNAVVSTHVLNDSIMYSEVQLFIIMCYILVACKIKMFF